MNEAERQFVAAIAAEPEAAAPKLVFADWLEERGDDRAAVWRWIAARHRPDTRAADDLRSFEPISSRELRIVWDGGSLHHFGFCRFLLSARDLIIRKFTPCGGAWELVVAVTATGCLSITPEL